MRKPNGEFMVWTAHPSLKINQKKSHEVAKMVIDQIEAAISPEHEK